ncbi:MAG: phosphate acyltransferase PlsX [Candidatus Eisenbacteria bacterium]|nr:phosphate acyltransferase PlsX [Candidatus Eisenbacteria bacterium]
MAKPRVAVDAMGGDHAPQSIVGGSILAAETFGSELQVVLIGDEPAIRRHLSLADQTRLGIEVVHSSETIGMAEAAATAYRKKPDASIVVATRMLKARQVHALVSAGNTGAVVTSSLLGLGRLAGVQRPAIATIVPTPTGHCLLLDVGANSDSKPMHLFQFAVMGKVYAQQVYGVENPKVGLLNIGEESCKGSDLTQQAHKLLEEGRGQMNFIGNVEGKDILTGHADVVVCDGFTGNVILKFAESVVNMAVQTVRREIESHIKYKIGAGLLRPVFSGLKNKLNYEEYGGAPLLGVDGVVVISHGRSTAKAIMNAIRVGGTAARQGVAEKIGEELARELQRQEATG